MKWTSDPGGHGPRGYHHGNLREALIEAALRLIAESGTSGFTFAEAARRAGVSAAAPYRHFKDRDELLAEVARRGFELLEAALTKGWNGGKPDTLSAFSGMGFAYLEFARSEPAHFSAMFEAGIPADASPDLRAASDAAFAVLRRGAEEVVALAPSGQRPPALMVALHAWTQAHGIAALFGRGDGCRRPLPMTPNDLLEASILVYLQGLGIRKS
jgi:AcrR family transcriptional regulator